MNKPTVLEWCEETKNPPPKITVTRTTTSKYLFYVLVRFYRQKVGKRPEFLIYAKGNENSVRSQVEEHSILSGPALYVLEGFTRQFVDSLHSPEGTYIVAETNDGDLEAPNYSFKMRRDILKILMSQLGLKLSLRAVLKLDWSKCRDYADYEVLLRRAKVMDWSEDQLESMIQEREEEKEAVLLLMKRGQKAKLLELTQKYGAAWMANHLTESVVKTAQFRILRSMGYEPDRVAREMEVGWYHSKELEETAAALTKGDLLLLANRIVKLDRLIARNRGLGVDLLLLNTPIGFSR